MHSLWYDLRTQSMFEENLREAVTHIDKTLEEMIWRVVSRYAELAGRPPAMTPAAAYGVLDGLFQQALLGHVAGDTGALPTLVDQVHGADAADPSPRHGRSLGLPCAGPCSLPSRVDDAPIRVDAAAPRASRGFFMPAADARASEQDRQ